MSTRALWEAHVLDSMPDGLARARICGYVLAVIDAHAAACMVAHFERGGLGNPGLLALQECHTDLSEVLEWHVRTGREADPYLVRMHAITGGILGEVCRKAAKRRPRRRWWQMEVRGAAAG